MTRVYRVQDASGRGPFRPGFTVRWADKELAPGVDAMPTWMQEFGADLLERRGLPLEHYGCGVRKLRDLARWFSASECLKLAEFGFYIAHIAVARVLAESANQLVFGRRTSLVHGVIVVPWEAIATAGLCGCLGDTSNTDPQPESTGRVR